ncbi:ras and EF-hand domain-containing protein [Gadus morhua]|uniref:ras and EF-hand domain-containing protein n=1 Tax=Gadus morhua TaxID=8049 RepID=UPI0011B40B57|nr:ras and EF-hand domain-containing protein [Gadus morhua]
MAPWPGRTFERRLGEQAMFIPRKEQAATLYQNIRLTEPRLMQQYERVILNFTKEIRQHNGEMENLALAVKRAQDQATMQLSEMEEEMDHRIQAAEKKSRHQNIRKRLRTEAALNELRRSYETEICELQCKIQRMQVIEEKFKNMSNRDESFSLKKRINELTIENQRLKQDLMKSQTNIACLQSEMDSLKTDLTDQSMNSERLYEHSEEEPEERLYRRRPSCDALALAMCDPGLRRRHSSECEEDSLPESCMDSGLSTLRGSRGEYDSEPEERPRDCVELGFMSSEKAYRIVLAGDAAVGKSSFLLRLCKNEFRLNGVDFQMKTLTVDGEPTVLQLWDTAGQERFRSIAKSYFRRAEGVLLLYDVTCERSFLNVREWVDMIEDLSHDDIPIMLVGNKCDMRQQGIVCVPTSYGEKLAMTYNAMFCETSAKDGSNVLEAVLHLAREVTKKVLLEDSGVAATTVAVVTAAVVVTALTDEVCVPKRKGNNSGISRVCLRRVMADSL